MSISTIGGGNAALAGTQFSSLPPVHSGEHGRDGDHDRDRVSGSFGGGGKFASAITQALSELGIAPGASSSVADPSTPAATQDSQHALASFVQTLFAALHAQGAGHPVAPSGPPAATGDEATNVVPGAAGHGRHQHAGGLSKLESALQNLIQQLSSSAQSTSDPGNSGASSSNVTLTNLQQGFNHLLAVDGIAGSGATLSNFLQVLSQNLQGTPTTGNVVSTSA